MVKYKKYTIKKLILKLLNIACHTHFIDSWGRGKIFKQTKSSAIFCLLALITLWFLSSRQLKSLYGF